MTSDPVDQTRRTESSAANTFRLSPDPPLFVRGQGAWLETADGRCCLDLVCGSATSLLGHGHPAHLSAISATLQKGILHTGTRLPSPERAALYAALQDIAPDHLDTVHLANSGAEAIETAIKAAMYNTGRHGFVAFEGGYHGRTLGALALTHSPSLRQPFLPGPGAVAFAPYATSDAECDAALAELDAILDRHPPVAALVIEAVQGVSGVRGPNTRFLQGVEAAARRHGALLILDEIWSGLGRSGRWFAFEYGDLTPDLVALGKGVSASLPLSAVLGRASILHSWPAGSHTSTFQGNPLACAAAVATLGVLQSEDLVARAATVLQPALQRALQPALSSDAVVGLRVVGAQAAVQLQSAEQAVEVQRQALDADILVYGGGLGGECVMIIPPLNIEVADLELALKSLGRIIQLLG